MTTPDTISEARRQLLEKLRRGEVQVPSATAQPPIPRTTAEEAPLSPGQEQIWFHAQLAASAPVYNESVTIHKRGPLDPAILERCFNEIVRRHEIWRSTFPISDGKVLQRVHSNVAVHLPLIDLSHLPDGEREAEAVRIASEDVSRPFDLNVAPLFRLRLVRCAADDHRIYLTLHHLVFDGVSIYRVLISELAELYSAYSAGRPSPLPDLPVQYRDYAAWKKQPAASGDYDAQMKYWRETLSDNLPSFELPSDRPRPAESTCRGGMETCAIPAALVKAVKELGRSEGLTPYMILLAVFQVLLHRYSGQDEIVVGGATNTRTRPEFEPLIGYFLNAVVFRTRVGGDLSFREFLGRVKSMVLGAMAHSEIPFDAIVRELAPKRDSSRHPLFQVLFSMRPPFSDFPQGWDVTDMEVHSGASGFDLFVEFSEHLHGLAGRVVYSIDLFDRTTIQNLLRHFQTLLAGALANPQLPISQLPLLDDSERRRILVEWNSTDTEFAGERSVHELFEEQARKTPDAIAVMFEDASLSYAELNRRANRLAHHLKELGAGPDERVAVCLERSPELIVALLGVLKSGAAYVPLDPAFPMKRRQSMLKDSGPVALLTAGHLEGLFAGIIEGLPVLDLTAIAPDWQNQPDTNLDAAGMGLTSRHLAYVMYTSGSTGTPKGVMVPHRAINRLVLNNGYAKFEAGDRVAFASNPAFDASTMEVWAPLLNGGRVVVIKHDVLLDPVRLGQTLERYAVNTLWLTVGLFNHYADTLSEQFGKLRHLIVGGDALDPRVIARVLRSNPPEHLINGYGPTETTTFAITHEIAFVPENARSVPIGRPIANTRVYILDPHGDPVPVGVAGELYIGGAGVARGYLNRLELTAERFLPDRFTTEPEARMYRTGDLGRWLPDGTIEFLGRNDFQVKIRGFRVELGEIEARLAEQAGVRDVVVVAREDTPGDKRLVAYYTSDQNEVAPGAELLRAHLSATLPEYMVPAAYVRVESLPLTPNGKLDRKALPAPEFVPAAKREFVPPQDDLEERLCNLWQEVLAVHPISVTDNYFDLGGHSLLALRLFSEIKFCFQLELPLGTLFYAPTVRTMAEVIRDAGVQAASPIVPIQPNGAKPAIFCIGALNGEVILFRRLALELGPDQPLYGLQPFSLVDRLSTIETLAAGYIEQLRKWGERRPFCLLGYSFGGLVALEMAQQLRKSGAEPPLVVLIDSTYLEGCKALEPWKDRIRRYRYHVNEIVHGAAGVRHLVDRLRSRYFRMVHKVSTTLGVEVSKIASDIRGRQLLAAESYRAKPYPGRVHLLKAESRPEFFDSDAALGWGGVLSDLRIEQVPGDHGTMNTGMNLKILARKLVAALEKSPGSQSATKAASASFIPAVR